MKFIVDSQLPELVTTRLQNLVYVNYLSEGNKTTDHEILDICESESRVLITREEDFIEGFILRGRPREIIYMHPACKCSKLLKLMESKMDYVEHIIASEGIYEVT